MIGGPLSKQFFSHLFKSHSAILILSEQVEHQLSMSIHMHKGNDGWFNGVDIFQLLLVLGNADYKALIDSIFTRKPTFKFSSKDT